jgi:diadenosine tetraphosphate (Ap4A) HIT family hydrolase
MANHPAECEICARIEDIRAGNHPGFLAELPTGYAVLGDSQFFRGYTIFLCKDAAPDLEDLPRERRFQFLREMALVSEAVSRVLKPHKMNVESLGNMVPHLHFHLFPRTLDEKEPLKPVWLVMPSVEDAAKYALDVARDGELIEALRREIVLQMAAN